VDKAEKGWGRERDERKYSCSEEIEQMLARRKISNEKS
jgi:hypothetical protein